MPRSKSHQLLLIVILLAATALVFGQVLNHSFVDWDDIDLVVKNPGLNPPSVARVAEFWKSSTFGLYTPLAYTAWSAIACVAKGPSGLQAGGFHAFNLVLHVASVVLVFSILLALTKSNAGAFFGAMLFAIHPLQAEPVSWVAGMNNLLGGALGLAAIRLYIAYLQSSDKSRQKIFYASAGALFVLATLAKPTAVVVSLILIVIDLVILRRPWRHVASDQTLWLGWCCFISFIARSVQPASEVPQVPLWFRPIVALDVMGFYLGKLLFPAQLRFDYSRTPTWLMESHAYVLPAIAIVAVGLVLALLCRRSSAFAAPALIAAAALLPVLGLVPFDFQKISTPADRYAYLALLGPALLVAMILARRPGAATHGAALLLTVALGILTFFQVATWKNTATLADHCLSIDPGSPSAHFILAKSLTPSDPKGAIEQYQLALKRDPGNPAMQYNLANLYLSTGRYDDAIAEYQSAIPRLAPRFRPAAHNNLGVTYIKSGQKELAVEEFKTALAEDPNFAPARRSLSALTGGH